MAAAKAPAASSRARGVVDRILYSTRVRFRQTASPARPPANVIKTLIPSRKQSPDAGDKGPARRSARGPMTGRPLAGRRRRSLALVGDHGRWWRRRRRRRLGGDAGLREIVAGNEELMPRRAFGAMPVGIGQHPA